jgi:guanine deaminase
MLAFRPMTASLPTRPPFALRATVLTPLDDGGTEYRPDGIVEVDAAGRIAAVRDATAPVRDGTAPARGAETGTGALPVVDLRPLVLLPGMVDLHAHLPQLPNAGLGFGLDLLTWLQRYIFPLEQRWEDPALAGSLSAAAFRAFAHGGTTTVLASGAVYEAAMHAAFEAAESHGIRAILGKVMMDRITYDESVDRSTLLERSLRESEALIGRWHGADAGRLGYAVTPRFAVSCSAEMLRASAALAKRTGAWWQTHLSEDPGEIAEVGRLFPEATDYVDVYDRAGGLGSRAILAHAVHLSDRELSRLVETDTRVAHCPASNLFLASGIMPLARYREAGLGMGLGSDVAGGPESSAFSVMRIGAYAQTALRTMGHEDRPALGPLDWLRLGSLEGARALGLDDRIGSIEAGKEADLIAVDPRLTVALPNLAYEPARIRPEELMSRLIFRSHPDMVRGAWVRGRRLDGPGEPTSASS